MSAAKTARSIWPSGPTVWPRYPDDDHVDDQAMSGQGPAQEVIGEMAGMLRDTRGNMAMSGATLAAITIGVAIEAAHSAQGPRPGVVGMINIGLFCCVLLCWLRAVTLVALAGRPVLNTLSELRWRTGAPADPRPRWLTLPPMGASPEEWTWASAHLLLSAARLSRYRMQLAETWIYVTAACFLAWTVVILLGL